MAQRKFVLSQVAGLGAELGQSLVLTDNEQVLGRSERADLEIAVPIISRRHASVWVEDGIPYVKDLGSGHGTFVNSSRITDTVTLRQGDLFSLGNEVVFLVSGEEHAEIDVLAQEQIAKEDSVDSSLVELALTDAAPTDKLTTYMSVMHDIQLAARQATEVDRMLRQAIDKLQNVITCDRFLALLGETPETMKIAARKLRRPDEGSQWAPPSSAILRRAMLSDKPVISFDAQTDKRFKGRQSIALSNVRSAICVSLRSSIGPIGVLYADTVAATGLHSMEDGNFMMLVADTLTLRIRELQLEDELEFLRREIDELNESLLAGVATDINSHLNRLELIADDTSQREPATGRLLQAECDRLRQDVDRYLCWSKREATDPGTVEQDFEAPHSAPDPDAEDRRISAKQLREGVLPDSGEFVRTGTRPMPTMAEEGILSSPTGPVPLGPTIPAAPGSQPRLPIIKIAEPAEEEEQVSINQLASDD